MSEKGAATQQIHAVVHGRVQGVSFRHYTVQEALRLNVTGWVRNVSDGTVEVHAEGTRQQLEAFIAWLHIGSPHADVEEVTVIWGEASGNDDDFTVRYSR